MSAHIELNVNCISTLVEKAITVYLKEISTQF